VSNIVVTIGVITLLVTLVLALGTYVIAQREETPSEDKAIAKRFGAYLGTVAVSLGSAIITILN